MFIESLREEMSLRLNEGDLKSISEVNDRCKIAYDMDVLRDAIRLIKLYTDDLQ